MRLRSLLNVWLGAVAAVCLTPHTFGQATVSFAQLNGTVQDANGRVVVSAAVALRDLGTNQDYNATTNSSGYYFIPNLPPGHYELSVQYSGFAKYIETGIPLTVGQTATVNVTLKVASAGEVIAVSTEAPVVPVRRLCPVDARGRDRKDQPAVYLHRAGRYSDIVRGDARLE